MRLRIEQVSGDQQPAVELCKPPTSEAVICPRCGSTNTKFCYYNNYNKSQPRHYCKACKRHWTKGGTIRDVPVGGGRKKKRSRTTTVPGNKNEMSTPPTAGLDGFSENHNPETEIGFNAPFKENSDAASLLNMNPISYDPWDLDSMESSSIITSNIPLDLPSYCNWDDIDPLTTASLDFSDEFYNVHGEIKP